MVWQPEQVEKARGMTPGCEHVVHFNNAGASLMPKPVIDAMLRHIQREATIGGYEAAREAQPAIDRTYKAIANLLNSHPDEIALVENATRAWDMFFYSLQFEPGDRILVSRAEYASNYIAFLQMAKRRDISIEPIPNNATGAIDVGALASMIDDRVKLIAITHVPTNGGLVNPARAVGRVANAHGIVYLLDACQSAGQMPLDVREIGCDALSATGRKYLRGPRGTGFLYVARKWLEKIEPVFLDLHAATWTSPTDYTIVPTAKRFETWEGNVAGKLALGIAVEHASQWGLANIYERVQYLADWLRDTLATVPKVHVHDIGDERCGIVSFNVAGQDGEAIRAALHDARINVSVSPANSTLLDMQDRNLPEVVRASVHYYNTEDEIACFVDALASLTTGA